jgi:hypothetical protein
VLVVFGALFFSRRAGGRYLGVLGGWFGGEGRERDERTNGQSNPQKPVP